MRGRTLTALAPPAEVTVPCVGRFCALLGSRMPPTVLASASSAFTNTRSPTGVTVFTCSGWWLPIRPAWRTLQKLQAEQAHVSPPRAAPWRPAPPRPAGEPAGAQQRQRSAQRARAAPGTPSCYAQHCCKGPIGCRPILLEAAGPCCASTALEGSLGVRVLRVQLTLPPTQEKSYTSIRAVVHAYVP